MQDISYLLSQPNLGTHIGLRLSHKVGLKEQTTWYKPSVQLETIKSRKV